jgi:hypothetical protein
MNYRYVDDPLALNMLKLHLVLRCKHTDDSYRLEQNVTYKTVAQTGSSLTCNVVRGRLLALPRHLH